MQQSESENPCTTPHHSFATPRTGQGRVNKPPEIMVSCRACSHSVPVSDAPKGWARNSIYFAGIGYNCVKCGRLASNIDNHIAKSGRKKGQCVKRSCHIIHPRTASECLQSFGCDNYLRKHQSANDPIIVKCPQCQRHSKSCKAFEDHYKNAHPQLLVSNVYAQAHERNDRDGFDLLLDRALRRETDARERQEELVFDDSEPYNESGDEAQGPEDGAEELAPQIEAHDPEELAPQIEDQDPEDGAEELAPQIEDQEPEELAPQIEDQEPEDGAEELAPQIEDGAEEQAVGDPDEQAPNPRALRRAEARRLLEEEAPQTEEDILDVIDEGVSGCLVLQRSFNQEEVLRHPVRAAMLLRILRRGIRKCDRKEQHEAEKRARIEIRNL